MDRYHIDIAPILQILPPAPTANADLIERDHYRRARLTSNILLIGTIVLLVIMFVTIFGNNTWLRFVLPAILTVFVIAIFFNRYGKVQTAGTILVVCMELGFFLSIVFGRKGLDTYNLSTFDLMTIVLLIAVAVLPAISVFIIAAINSLYIWVTLTFLPHTLDLQHTLTTNGLSVYLRPIALQIITAVVIYLWVQSNRHAIARADRAEVIASLQHAVAQQEHTLAQQKRQLDASVQQIIDTHVQVSNGNFEARVPLTDTNVLWQVAGSLNNLLSRLQRYRQDSIEYEHIKNEIAYLSAILRQSNHTYAPTTFKRTGTPLDMLILELNTKLRDLQRNK